ncbi:MAG: hypothetical protein KAJ19_20340, partial [Gammaproteobacteria bacterium]|nr:hypothetical protein [Gammaproteobacteria bacterium]
MEVIVIFGVLLVVVLVVLFAVQEGSILPNTIPQNIYNEQKAVAKTVGDRMRDALDYTLRDMMMHGGYIGDQGLGTVSYNDVAGADFLLTKVPYWVRCDQVSYPQISQIETWMEHSIEKKMRDGMNSLEIEYGNLAEFDTEGITIDVDVQGMNEYEADKIVV